MAKSMKPAHSKTNLEIILEELSETPKPAYLSLPGVLIGKIVAFVPEIGPFVDFPGNPKQTPLASRSTVHLESSFKGKEVTLLFEGANVAKPIITGVLQDHVETPGKDIAPSVHKNSVVAHVDGESLVLKAEEEIVLECGKASITLTKAGKVLIKGEYVLSRSSGANKIKGGSVQIN
jgi:Domain of unknown function (DUF6484)